MRLRLCTFNIENLFTRFDFRAFDDPWAARYMPSIVQFYRRAPDGDLSKFADFKRMVETAAISQDDDRRQQTALAFAEADADIYCLQEVDSFDALSRFMDAYVKKIGVDRYDQIVVHEGNDRRGIDVAAVARDIRPIMTRSHAPVTLGWIRDEPSGEALIDSYGPAKETADGFRGRIFRRDCLEIEVRMRDDLTVTLFNCHFKSMGGGRKASIGMRQLEAIAVREIINRKFPDPAQAMWAVLGDLNDYRQRISISKAQQDDGSFLETIKVLDSDEASGVDPLLDDGFGVNMLDALPETDRWTHYYSGERHKTQLDYVIASPALAARVDGPPQVIRQGMPFRVPNLDLPRYPRIGWDRPKASDHCPLIVEFDL